jgi:beta-lactamase regulating signal transducer with metallopeptidase domain
MLCLATVLSGYVYTYANGTMIKQVSLIFLCLSVAVWAYLYLRRMIKIAKIRLSVKKYAVSTEIPDYGKMQKLTKEMKVKLDEKQPFVLRKGLNNAYYDLLHSRIVLGDILFNKLETQERIALVTHELTHIKRNHPAKQLIFLPVVLAILLMLTLHREPDLVFLLVWIAFILTIFPYPVSRC